MNQNPNSRMLLHVPVRNSFSFFLFLIPFLFFSSQSSFAQYQKTQKAVNTKIGSYVNAYYESLPVDYASNTSQKYPLLIFIHGVGEVGNGTTQLSLVLRNGPPKLLNEGKFPSSFTVGGKDFSFIVISPQLTDNNYTAAPIIINDIINHCKQKYRIDEQRIYLTGLSMGGTMTWQFGANSATNADKIAASLPVCGNLSYTAAKIANIGNAKLPVWATINSGDPVMSAAKVTAAIAEINGFVPTPPKALSTVFPVSGHDAWTKTYDPNFKQGGLNVYEWMLSYARGTASQPAPVPPTANAGSNQTITLPANSVTLDGSKSAAPSGSITSYAWSKLSGPAASIASASSVKTSVTGLVAGTYQFQLTVKDSNGKSSSANVSVTVNEAGGTAPLQSNAGGNQTITLPTNSVTVDGSSKSTYPLGSTFLWVKKDGPEGGAIASPASLKTAITGLSTDGDYQFQLRITDKNGNVSASSMHVIVNPATASSGGTALKSNAGGNQTITLPTNSVTVDGSAKSTYPLGSTFLWVKKDGPAGGTIASPASLKTAITGLNTAGDYQFQLRITDKNGNVSATSMHVIVNPAAASSGTTTLKSVAGSSQIITLPQSSVTLDGTGSSGPSGLTHLWKQTSGPKTATVVSIYSIKTDVTGLTVEGTYSFQLELKDPNGNTAVSTVNIIVNAPAGSTLKSVAGNNQTITLPSSSVNLDGTGSSGPVGLTHLWKQTGGPKTATIGSIYSIKTTVSGLTTAGTYSFQLELKDPNGNVATSTVQIIVNGAAGTSSKSSSSGGVEFQANAGSNQTVIQPEKSATLDGTKSTWPSSSGTTHFWQQVNGPATASIPYPYSIRADVSGLTAPGDYQFQIVLTDSKGHQSTSSTHVIVQAAGTTPSARVSSPAEAAVSESIVSVTSREDLEIRVNPNPVQSDMNISITGSSAGAANIMVYNMQGQIVLQEAFVKDNSGTNSKSLNVSKLSAGIYIVQVMVGNKYKQIIRIVKQ